MTLLVEVLVTQTDGCKGCRAIVYGTARTGHDNHCRHRVIKTAATNADVAARVRQAIDRDVEWHAKKLEANETNKRGPEAEASTSSEERKAKDQRREEGAAEASVPLRENVTHTPGSSSQGQSRLRRKRSLR